MGKCGRDRGRAEASQHLSGRKVKTGRGLPGGKGSFPIRRLVSPSPASAQRYAARPTIVQTFSCCSEGASTHCLAFYFVGNHLPKPFTPLLAIRSSSRQKFFLLSPPSVGSSTIGRGYVLPQGWVIERQSWSSRFKDPAMARLFQVHHSQSFHRPVAGPDITSWYFGCCLSTEYRPPSIYTLHSSSQYRYERASRGSLAPAPCGHAGLNSVHDTRR